MSAFALAGAGLAATGTANADPATTYFCSDNTVPMTTVNTVETTYDTSTPVTGLSVVSGTTPTQFTGTYIGSISDGIGKGKDMLLFQLSSDTINGANGIKAAGIWAGMSGSPVYAQDGSLIGAVSYSLNADNLPIAGVTPAEYMKTIGTSTLAAPAKVKVSAHNLRLARGASTSSKAVKALDGSTFEQAKLAHVAAGSAANAKPVNMLLARSGKKSTSSSSALSAKDFQMVGDTDAAINDPLTPGGNIAVSWATGDAFAGGIGTVTAICGNDVWAFGHPMDYAGNTTLGFANASAALIVPDSTGTVGSYKQVSAIGDPVGTITQDRLVGIKGSLGAVAGYPASVTVDNAAGQQVDSRSSLVNVGVTAPDLVPSMLYSAVEEDLDNAWDGTARVTSAVSYKTASGRTGTIHTKQIYASTAMMSFDPATDLGNELYDLLNNGFTSVQITKIATNVTLLNDQADAYAASGVQYKTQGTWQSLKGKRLKAGHSYSVRPVYTHTLSGQATGVTSTSTVYGATRSLSLGKKATGSGWLEYRSENNPWGLDTDSECDLVEGGCFSFDWDEDGWGSFQELVDMLESATGNQVALQKSSYRLSHGRSVRARDFDAPGFVTGRVQASFRIGK